MVSRAIRRDLRRGMSGDPPGLGRGCLRGMPRIGWPGEARPGEKPGG